MKKNVVLLILVLNFISNTYARDLNVTVYDRDLDFPLEGVRIQETEGGQEIYTDFNGAGTITVEDGATRAVLIIELVGYETRKQLVTDLISPVNVYMLMEGVLEGEELVVEVEAIGETDAEVGVSTVVEEEIIQSAAKIGLIEDAMAAVKILPGVSYSGGMASNLSIRGSDPNGLVTVMDGMIVRTPYHFGGMVSIFNPNIVESIKFSPGIFSVKHGQATSALMEVNTVTPDNGTKLSYVASTSTNELFFQSQLGEEGKVGLLGGARATFWEPAMRFMGWFGEQVDDPELKYMSSSISTYPFIYDFYLKGFYRPTKNFEWYINGFSGNDGLGQTVGELPGYDMDEEVLPTGSTDYGNQDLIVSTGVSILPTDNFLINYVVGYDYKKLFIDQESGFEGRQFYSDNFKEVYEIEEESTYIKFDDTEVLIDQVSNRVQTRLDLDFNLNDSILLQGGGGTYYETFKSDSKGFIHTFMPQDDLSLKYQKIDFDYKGDDDKRVSSFGYLNINGDIIPDLLSVEAGVRVDHFYQDVEDNDDIINTNLIPAPRVRFSISPKDTNQLFTSNNISIGSGLFNIAPWESGFSDIPDKSLTSVVGWDTYLPFGFHFKLEGYYKYLFDRTYVNSPITYKDREELKDLAIFHSDGYGHIGGGDLLLERKISRYIDGMMSYTYVYARYMDPKLEDGYEYDKDGEAPRGEYYWPSFHRFHSLNLLLNVKPSNVFTITSKLSLASGLPERDYQQTVTSQIIDHGGEPFNMELYDHKNLYSDNKRADIELPLDIKFTYHNYLPESKYNWEIYLGIQNVLAPLLVNLDTSPGEQGNMLSEQDSSDGGFAFPTPSIGFKLSF